MRQSTLQYAILVIISVLLLYVASIRSVGSPWQVWRSSSSPPVNKTTSNPYGMDFTLRQQLSFSNTLIIAKLKSEATTWAEEDLADLNIGRAFYTVDDNNTLLQTPSNKGHEAMVYLTYIIDFYDNLPDISTFMHSHAETWHNNDLLERSSAEMVRRLSLEKVAREGYVNLRCHLNPGCPGHLTLQRPEDAGLTADMALIVATAFTQLFPHDQLPELLSQPCCAQFAVSRDAIRRHPKSKYITLRQWLMDTELGDHVSGRLFEFLWHYIFTSRSIFCPSIHLCYCDTYSVCFPSAAAWEEYHAMLATIETLRQQENVLSEDEAERKLMLRRSIDTISAEVGTRKMAALAVGQYSREARQKILFEAWDLLHKQGDLH